MNTPLHKNQAGQPSENGGHFAAAAPRDEAIVGLSDQTERTFTCFGSWVDDELSIDYTVEGEQPDHRPEFVNGFQSFCASATARTAEEAEAKVIAEYDPQDEDECECSESYLNTGFHTPGCPADDGERA